MFKGQDELMKVGAYLAHLEQIETRGALTPLNDEEAKQKKGQLKVERQNVSRYYSDNILGEMASGVRYSIKKTAEKTFYSRLIMAVFGGFALVVPMLIMTLHQTKLTSLLTTSIFVLAVALALAWFMDTAEPKDIIGATAAYAAVLVVFVGAGTPTPTGA